MADATTLRVRIAKYEATLERLTAERNRFDNADSGDPAAARLRPNTLRRHYATTDRDLVRYTTLLNRIDATNSRLIRARGQLSRIEPS